MAFFDTREQRVGVRVVYDGVACAGKTTNLRQLCLLFAAQRYTELCSPAELHGRTLFFDWMQLMAGVACGFPLLCQVLSVPGQVVLAPRRRHLLTTADVVVYVCESSESGVAAARSGLELHDQLARERGAPLPLVIQANKQDQPGALDGPELLRALGREGTPLIEGIASDGVGVVDTFVMAVRTVVRDLQRRADEGELRLQAGHAETSADVLARLVEERLDPEWAAEMLLEEAQAAFQMEGAMAAIATDAGARAAAAAAALELTAITVRAPRNAEALTVRPASGQPPLPSPDVPTGFIWPAHTGRGVVRSLGLSPASAVEEHGDAFLHVSHGHVMRTSTRAHFADAEAARQALVRNARECTQLERLLVPETVLVAQSADDGACWIWTVRPDVATVESSLRRAGQASELLSSYGSAVVDALRSALRHNFSVDLSPRSFGVHHGLLRYLGEVVAHPQTAATLSASMFAAVRDIEHAGADVHAFLDSFERALQRSLTPEERARATLSLGEPPIDADLAPQSAGERLSAVLARASEPS